MVIFYNKKFVNLNNINDPENKSDPKKNIIQKDNQILFWQVLKNLIQEKGITYFRYLQVSKNKIQLNDSITGFSLDS